MADEWKTNPEIVEGEYEVVEERDAVPAYQAPQGGYLETDPSPPYLTYILLGMNIAAWLLMTGIGWLRGMDLNTQLYVFGAKVNELIIQGQYWRLLTAMFLHIGIMHLFFNSYALYLYGPIVEKLYGKMKFGVIYILSGLLGSLMSYLFSPNPAAGASGAIFGLMGALLYFRRKRRDVFQRVFGPGLFIIIGINLFYGFVQPGIDNWGHIGGLLGGFLVGTASGLYRERGDLGRRLLLWLLIIGIFGAGIAWGQQKYGQVIYLEKAREALENGDYENAERYAEGAAESSLSDPRLKEVLERIYFPKLDRALGEGKPEEGMKAIQKLLDYYPKDPNFLYIRAQLYEQNQQFDLSLQDYLEILKSYEDIAEVWYRAGNSAYQAGKYSKAKEYLNRVLDLNPSFLEAKSLLEKIKKETL